MNNSIAQRIADFLKEHKPFSFLTNDELLRLAQSVKIKNLEKNKILFQVNDLLHDSFYVVNSGLIQLSNFVDAEEFILGKCSSGDIFGLRPFFSKINYQMIAKAREESIVFLIPIEDFKPFLGVNNNILNFMLESFAINNKTSSDFQPTQVSNNFTNSNDTLFLQTLNYSKKILLINSDAVIKETAQQFSDNQIDNAIILEDNCPVGIVTDKDFRSKVVTGKVPTTHTVDKIMASPVFTVPESISLAEAQLIMLRHSISHLCVTIDGTNKSSVKGVITQSDLINAQANSPGVLMREIKHAQNAKDLKGVRDNLTEIIQSSLTKNIPLTHLFSISGELTLTIIKRAIELSILEIGSPPASFAWFSIGSQARKEQLLHTDQDSYIVFEDVAEDKYRDTKDYFLKLAKKTTSTLEKIGYPLCEHNHMASNLLWCKSLTDWMKQYNTWMNTPGENTNEISNIFFDFEIVFGSQKIYDALTETVLNNSSKNILFFDFLGNDALKKPDALNFFGKLNLEDEGENKGKFDIKNKAIAKLVDCARLLCLHFKIKGINNTYLRFKQLIIVDDKNAEVYNNCAEAFLFFSKLRTIQGLNSDANGQFISIEALQKSEKEKLKEFLETHEKIEEIIKDKFQLTQFS